MAHDFKKYPELTNNQMQLYYFQSPHKQITEDFRAKVEKVIDGDTIRVSVDFRDFNFPIRFLDIDAPEMDTPEGVISKKWLENLIMNEEIEIKIDLTNKIEKWGRLLGRIMHRGIDIGEESLRNNMSEKFEKKGFIKEELII